MTSAPVAVDPLIGVKVLGIYTIRKEIGAGGMGTVYRAEPETGHPIAVKVLNPDQCSPEMIARFRVEAKLMDAIRHDNVVKLLGVDTVPDGRTFMALEFVEGRTLGEHLASWGPLTTADALPIVIQLCGGLQAIHGAGILHRDLKPENVIICRDGKVKILDFGIAKSVAPEIDARGQVSAPRPKLTQTGMVLGTRAYMAPEQAEGAKVGLVADVFALGVIVFEMLTGRRPFEPADGDDGTDPAARIVSLIHYYVKVGMGALPKPSLGAVARAAGRTDITDGWIRAVDGALAVSPASRTQTIRLFIEPILEDSPWANALVGALAPTLLERGSAMDRTLPADASNALPPVESKLRDARPTEVGDDTFSGQPERARMMSTIAQSSGQVAATVPPRGRGLLFAALAGAAVVAVVLTAFALARGNGARGGKAPGAAPVQVPAAPTAEIRQPSPTPPPAQPAANEPPAQPAATDPASKAATTPASGSGAAPTAPVVDDSGRGTTRKRIRKPPGGTRSRDPDGLDI